MSRTRHTAHTCRPEFMACHPQSPASRQKLAEKSQDSNRSIQLHMSSSNSTNSGGCICAAGRSAGAPPSAPTASLQSNTRPKTKPSWRAIMPRPDARTSPTAGRSTGRFSSSRRPSIAWRGPMRRPDGECWVRAAQQHPGNLLHSSGLATNDARHDVYPRASCDGC